MEYWNFSSWNLEFHKGFLTQGWLPKSVLSWCSWTTAERGCNQFTGNCRVHSWYQGLSASYLMHRWVSHLLGLLAYGARFYNSHRGTSIHEWILKGVCVCVCVYGAKTKDDLCCHDTDILQKIHFFVAFLWVSVIVTTTTTIKIPLLYPKRFLVLFFCSQIFSSPLIFSDHRSILHCYSFVFSSCLWRNFGFDFFHIVSCIWDWVLW